MWELEEAEAPKVSQRGTPNTTSQWEFEPISQEAPKRKASDMNWFERKFTNEGLLAEREENINFLKSTFSGATAGYSEYFDTLKPKPEEEGYGAGQLAGAALPISAWAKAVSYPFKAIQGLTTFGKAGTLGLNAAKHATTGALYGATKESAKVLAQGHEFEPEEHLKEIGFEAATFGALGAILESVPGVSRWIKDKLTPSQQSKILVEGVLPENLTPNQYKFWEEEGLPAIQKAAEQEHKVLLEDATKKSELDYQQKLANTKAEHEAELYEMQRNNELNQQSGNRSQEEYQNKLKQIAAEHEAEVAEIEKYNNQAKQEFERQQQAYQDMVTRQNAVVEATRLRPGEENLPYRQAPTEVENPSLENRVGNVISKNEITNTTNAGRANIEAVRANDAIDYAKVNEAYAVSDELNQAVETIHPGLIQDLENTAREIRAIPEPSPPQKQLLGAIEKTLDKLRTVDEAGNITGFLDVNNRVLQEQAKAFRYFMDFTFEHGNTKGIFSPTVRNLETAVETAARNTGKPEAAEASQNARSIYRQWSDDYNNDYIRPYRDRSNFDNSKIFKSSLDVDEYQMLDRILQRSNEGQQLSGSTKRALVEKHLGKYLENPHSANRIEFENTLKELRSVISGEEENAIRSQFEAARKQIPIKEPTQPKLKELPSPRIPLAKESTQVREIPGRVKLPKKPLVEETPEIKMAAKRMNMKPEEAMRDINTHTGRKEIKKLLSKTDSDRALFEKIGKQKMRETLYQGNIKHKFTGKELEKIINEGDNFSMFSDFLGEEAATDLLDAAIKIGEKRASVDTLQKYTKHSTTIKAALIFGIL